LEAAESGSLLKWISCESRNIGLMNGPIFPKRDGPPTIFSTVAGPFGIPVESRSTPETSLLTFC
jgi:hypothetical protein